MKKEKKAKIRALEEGKQRMRQLVDTLSHMRDLLRGIAPLFDPSEALIGACDLGPPDCGVADEKARV